MAKRWKNRPPGSNWGDFGEEDQLGSLNLVGPDQVKKGIAEVFEGKTFSLSLPLDYPGQNVLHPRRYPPRRFSTLRGGANAGEQCFCFPLSRDNPFYSDVVSDDLAVIYTQYSTQWDGLAHIGSEFDANGDGVEEIVFYNGFRSGEEVLPSCSSVDRKRVLWDSYESPSATRLGMENPARHGVQGRAVLVNLHRHFGNANHPVGYEELMRILDEDQVLIERGDIVCFYTGMDQLILSMNKEPDPSRIFDSCSGLDGSDTRLLEWITNTGIAALASDNFAVELMPRQQQEEKRHAMLPLHEHCIFKNGIHLGELWYLHELAVWLEARNRSRFLLTAPPLNLPGAVGSPVTPVATV